MPNGSTIEKKFQRVITVCKYIGLNFDLHKCGYENKPKDRENGKDKI
jgi:hypothetical protein